jgi:hypothetical protein
MTCRKNNRGTGTTQSGDSFTIYRIFFLEAPCDSIVDRFCSFWPDSC